jgi:hypothetical protein
MKWQASIDVWDIHGSYQSGDITIDECAVKLAERLESYRDKTNFSIDSDEFEELTELATQLRYDVEGDVENYDGILCDIYDWADEGKRLWLSSFKPND